MSASSASSLPRRERTQTIECLDDVEMMVITYDKVAELYFQNPTFGFYFLELTSERLLQNVRRLERDSKRATSPQPALKRSDPRRKPTPRLNLWCGGNLRTSGATGAPARALYYVGLSPPAGLLVSNTSKSSLLSS